MQVQIRPWNLSDSDFVMDGSQPLDPRKTIFVGGVPRPLRAGMVDCCLCPSYLAVENFWYGNIQGLLTFVYILFRQKSRNLRLKSRNVTAQSLGKKTGIYMHICCYCILVELAMIMDRLYGGVCYAGIDTDPELKYPKGAGRVAFSNQQSYIAAISARFVQLQHGEIDKRVSTTNIFYLLQHSFVVLCPYKCHFMTGTTTTTKTCFNAILLPSQSFQISKNWFFLTAFWLLNQLSPLEPFPAAQKISLCF